MNLQVFDTYKDLSRAVADMIGQVIKDKPDAMICIASGHTPIGVFEGIVNDVQSGLLNISRCTFVSLDEWLGIDPSDQGSCLSMLRRDFFDRVPLNQSQVHYFDVQVSNPEEECLRIDQLIASHGGLDVMLVGIGTNGHIGMNEPGTPFRSRSHISELAEETRVTGQKYFTKKTTLTQGITLGLAHFSEAKLPILMANGGRKKAIMEKVMRRRASERLPATIIHQIQNAQVMVDREAYNPEG